MTAAGQKKRAIIWTILGGVSLVMLSAPFVFGIDMHSGGGALLFVGLIGVISSALVAAMYFKRAKTLAGMQSGERLLFRWELPADRGGETVVSLDGVITDGILYGFRDVACRLSAVHLKPIPESPRELHLAIDVQRRDGGDRTMTLKLPIPDGEAETAKQAAEKLRALHLSK